eukprot:5576655-Amphidinium_carterae.1
MPAQPPAVVNGSARDMHASVAELDVLEVGVRVDAEQGLGKLCPSHDPRSALEFVPLRDHMVLLTMHPVAPVEFARCASLLHHRCVHWALGRLGWHWRWSHHLAFSAPYRHATQCGCCNLFYLCALHVMLHSNAIPVVRSGCDHLVLGLWWSEHAGILHWNSLCAPLAREVVDREMAYISYSLGWCSRQCALLFG